MKRDSVSSHIASVGDRAAALARLGFQGAAYAFRVTRDDGEVGTRGLVGFRTALFPIAQRADGNMIAPGKFLLREAQGAA